MTEETTPQRIDKWLWHARFFKTRSLAQKQVSTGKIRVDREKISNPSRKVAPGNVLTITMERDVKVVEIAAIAQRRGPFSKAQLLYKDLSPPKRPEENLQKTGNILSRTSSEGRPNKRQRKQIIAMKRNSSQ